MNAVYGFAAVVVALVAFFWPRSAAAREKANDQAEADAKSKEQQMADARAKSENDAARIGLQVGTAVVSAALPTVLGAVFGTASTATVGTGVASGAASGAATGAATGTASSTSALSAAWTSVIGPAVAIVIVVVWLVAMTAITVGMTDAATRRAIRAAGGWRKVRQTYEALIAKQTEKNAMELIAAMGGVFQIRFNDGMQFGLGPGFGYSEIVPGTVSLGSRVTEHGQEYWPAGTFAAIGNAARFLAVEQVRALNDTVLNYFTRECGFTEAQVESNGDALRRQFFDGMVNDWFASNPVWANQFLGNPDGSPSTWLQVSAQFAKPEMQRIVGVAHFAGKQSGIAYVAGALAMLFFQSPGQQPIDESTAAACNPPTSVDLAWRNRVYGLNHEIQAGVFYDNEAKLAWMPTYSPPGVPHMYPYDTKGQLTSWQVGR